MALWSLDSASKNFFSVAWRYRSSIVGELKVVRSGIVRVPPDRSTSHHQSCGVPPISPPDHLKRFWSRWLPHVVFSPPALPPGPSKQRGGRRNFFVVWRGRKCGIFYKWNDCKASIVGFPDPGFKGFDTLTEAKAFTPPA